MEIEEDKQNEEPDRRILLESIQKRLDYLDIEKWKVSEGFNGKAVQVHVNIDNYESMDTDVVWNITMSAAQTEESTKSSVPCPV
eukprot:g69829.t1